MAARRGKSQAKRTSSSQGSTPGWVWLVLGLLIGAAVFFIFPGVFKKDGDGFFRPHANPNAQPATVDAGDDSVVPEAPEDAPASAVTATGTDAADGKETQYDFYTLLPGKEVQMSDAELTASAREEEARKAQAALENRSAAPVASAGADAPRPIAEDTPATSPPAAAAREPGPAAASVASADAGGRYILQAGAFGASGDAEATKAKIALLGLNARVESAEIGGKTVYRVRMGPYGSASDLAEAKQKLAGSGLPAMAIKAQ